MLYLIHPSLEGSASATEVTSKAGRKCYCTRCAACCKLHAHAAAVLSTCRKLRLGVILPHVDRCTDLYQTKDLGRAYLLAACTSTMLPLVTKGNVAHATHIDCCTEHHHSPPASSEYMYSAAAGYIKSCGIYATPVSTAVPIITNTNAYLLAVSTSTMLRLVTHGHAAYVPDAHRPLY
jgi:hypothetical protein